MRVHHGGGLEPCSECGELEDDCTCASAGGVEPPAAANPETCFECGELEDECECASAGGEEPCEDCGELEDDCVCEEPCPKCGKLEEDCKCVVPSTVNDLTALLNAIALANFKKQPATIRLMSLITIYGEVEISSSIPITLTLSADRRHFEVRNGTLTLGDGITLTRDSIYSSRNPTLYTTSGGGVKVSGGTFNMIGGKISNNDVYGFGGGVEIVYGTFNMTGGEISGNTAWYGLNTGYGGGVYVNYGTFNMTGGVISGNSAKGDGGGVNVQNNATFSMTGGEISGNTADNACGGGVYVYSSSTFTMNGGKISGNSATGSGGGGQSSCGGGVSVFGTFNMTGGEISGNTAKYGGGIFTRKGTADQGYGLNRVSINPENPIIFKNNTATDEVEYMIMEGTALFDYYRERISASTDDNWSWGLKYGVNNHDIGTNFSASELEGNFIDPSLPQAPSKPETPDVDVDSDKDGNLIITIEVDEDDDYYVIEIEDEDTGDIIIIIIEKDEDGDWVAKDEDGNELDYEVKENEDGTITIIVDDLDDGDYKIRVRAGRRNKNGDTAESDEFETDEPIEIVNPPSKPETPQVDVDSDKDGNLIITIEVDEDDDYYVIEIEDEDGNVIIIIIEKDEDGDWVAKDEDGNELDYEVKENEDGTITIVVDDLDDGDYKIRVRAGRRNKNGDTAESDTNDSNPPIEIVNPTAPSAPQNFSASAGSDIAILDWQAPASDGGSAITHYEYRYKAEGGSYSEWMNIGKVTGHLVTNLEEDTEYSFELRAVNKVGASAAASAKAITILKDPSVPEVTVDSEEGDLIIIIDEQDDADYYVIEIENEDTGDIIIILIEKDKDGRWRAKDRYGNELDYDVIHDEDEGTITIIVDDLDDGTYKVRVRAGRRDKIGIHYQSPADFESDPVEIVNPTAPSAPQNFIANGESKKAILNWEAPESDGGSEITRYEYRFKASDGSYGDWMNIGKVTGHLVTNLEEDTEYSFELRAVNKVGASAAASASARTPVEPPTKPETPDVDVDSEDGNLIITIEVDEDDDYYVIEIETKRETL